MFNKFFGNKEADMSTEPNEVRSNEVERLEGKIIKLNEKEGWGFISCHDIPFTRIFFHWTALVQDTLHFSKLERGMRVEFTPIEIEGRGYRAFRVKVIEDRDYHDNTKEEEQND